MESKESIWKDKSVMEERIRTDYRKQTRKNELISLGITLTSLLPAIAGLSLENKNLPEPTPIVRQYQAVDSSLSTLRNKLNIFYIHGLKPFELPYANEQMKQELQAIEKSEVGKIAQSLENAIQYAQEDSSKIAQNSEFIEYSKRVDKARNYTINGLYTALVFPVAGLIYDNKSQRKARRKRNKALSELKSQ